ncbi:MAG TPA: type 1 glutamine amidotransferase domain-containing protein [Candidatus Nitrosopolaris sp.]|nr:type 1 glutamine amidotransferase domain-containing protein [Candidatus Nitrosopolaris sp.]
MELKQNQSKKEVKTTAISVLLVGLILGAGITYAISNPVISTAIAQNIPTKKVLIVTTSHNVLGKTGYPTGVWLPEMTHPFSALQNARFNITVASVNGGNVPIDPYSIPSNPQGTNRDDPITEKFLHTPADVEIINHTVSVSTINPKDYAAVVFPGGNGATYDFPWDKNVNRIAAAIYEQGGIVAAVCHGPAALLNATLSNGQYLIKGMKVTGFSNEEEAITEILIGKKHVLPLFLENELPKRGAIYEKVYVHEPLVIVSGNGRLITGQNPESATNVGEKVVEILKGGQAT